MVIRILIAVLIPVSIFAQESGGAYIHKGLFCTRGSIAYGQMTRLNAKNIYLEGDIEYYIDDQVSLRADSYFFMGSFNSDKPFKMNHSIFTGVVYHFKTKSHFDPYIGIEPGINLAQATDICMGQPCLQVLPAKEPEKTASPLVSPIIGFNFFGNNWFHIAISARYVMGNFADNYNHVSLGEFRFSFGLGFNIN